MERPPYVFVLLALTITIAPVLSTIMSVHLLTILQARDIPLAAAVALGAIVGPSQVGARFIEMLIAKYHHPIWTKVASVTSLALGLGLLWGEFPLIALPLIFYGAGIGLESIARATLPLVLFGASNYAPIMGRLARPSLIAQAASPSDRRLSHSVVRARWSAGTDRRARLCQRRCWCWCFWQRSVRPSRADHAGFSRSRRPPGQQPSEDQGGAIAPTISAAMNQGVSIGRMPENVSVRLRAIATAGLAKQVEAVNQ